MKKLFTTCGFALLLFLLVHPALANGSNISNALLLRQYLPAVPRRAILYQRSLYALSFFEQFWLLFGFILFLITGASAALRNLLSKHSDSTIAANSPPGFMQTVRFYACFTLMSTCWMLPCHLAGWFLQRHYGFSSENIGLFAKDDALRYLLNLLEIPLIWAAYRFYARFPKNWWLMLWGFLVPVLFLQLILWPIVAAPLFNTFTLLPDGRLKTQILQMAAMAKIKHPLILVENTSIRSTHVNAYVTGIGSEARIVINDTDLRVLPDKQILAMVGHEMGHYKEHHVWWLFLSGVVGSLLLLYLLHILLPILQNMGQKVLHLNGLLDIAALPLILLTLNLCLLLQLPAANFESRYLEHRADAFGLRLTHLNVPMAQLMAGFVSRDYADPNPPALIQWWYGTHPTLKSRILFALTYHPWKK